MDEKDLQQEPLLCLICAWRKDCAKKYSFTGGQCLDFSRDVTVKLPEEAKTGEKTS